MLKALIAIKSKETSPLGSFIYKTNCIIGDHSFRRDPILLTKCMEIRLDSSSPPERLNKTLSAYAIGELGTHRAGFDIE